MERYMLELVLLLDQYFQNRDPGKLKLSGEMRRGYFFDRLGSPDKQILFASLIKAL
jgi:hypothetical protein